MPHDNFGPDPLKIATVDKNQRNRQTDTQTDRQTDRQIQFYT